MQLVANASLAQLVRLDGLAPVPPRPAPDLFCKGAMRAGPDWKTSRHDMAVWLPANIDDEDPCAVLA
jgi:hypothetical protein